MEVRRLSHEPRRATFWLAPSVELLEEPVSATARLAGALDLANGMDAREHPRRVALPNVDLTVHLVRDPRR